MEGGFFKSPGMRALPEILERNIAYSGYLTVERLRMRSPTVRRYGARWNGMATLP
jgi:hypothetical protein